MLFNFQHFSHFIDLVCKGNFFLFDIIFIQVSLICYLHPRILELLVNLNKNFLIKIFFLHFFIL